MPRAVVAALVAVAVVTLAGAGAAAVLPFIDARSSPECPATAHTGCPGNATCCQMQYSHSGYGCCHIPDAVCCDAGVMPTGDPIQNCCPAGHTCAPQGEYGAICIPPHASPPQPNVTALQVCTPGPEYAPNDPTQNPAGLPSVIIIGDSVSIGWTPDVISALNRTGIAYVQHSPWAGGGGAADTKNGLNCIEEFLRTADYAPAKWDAIVFNFGLHNLGNSTEAEAEYNRELGAITDRLAQTGSKLLYALTTPMMADYNEGNHAVEDDNRMATAIMTAHSIPMVDLYSIVTAHCGKVYVDCDICAVSPCTYHYKPPGYALLAAAMEAAITKVLQG